MSQYSLTQFFNDLQNKHFTVLQLDLSKNGNIIASLQTQLHNDPRNRDSKVLEELVDSQNFYAGKWTRFNIMITSFLKLCRDIDPWSSWSSCDVIFQFYTDLNNCLLNDTYPVDDLVNIFVENTEYIIPLAQSLDSNHKLLQTRKFQFLAHISSVISRVFNSIKPHNIGNDPNIGSQPLPGKQRILLYLVNQLNNIYFTIQSPQLCSNIFRNFKPKSSIDKFSQFSLKEQIEYRYLLGRYYLLNNRITNAFVQLNTAFNTLLKVFEMTGAINDPRSIRNLKRILRFLIPVGLIMGKLPNLNLVKNIDTEDEFTSSYILLIKAVRSGNIYSMNKWLQLHETELRQRHLLLILLEKLPVVTYRYLLKRVIQIWSIEQQSNRLPYNIFEMSLRKSINDTETSMGQSTDIFNGIHKSCNAENVLVTLINLGYLRGNCFPLLKLSVFQRTTNINDILPPIEAKMLTMFPLNNDDAWLDN
ncbi:nuclear mRNA export protein Thp1p [Monosporozyma servazzii]